MAGVYLMWAYAVTFTDKQILQLRRSTFASRSFVYIEYENKYIEFYSFTNMPMIKGTVLLKELRKC
mgnify:FL=1